MLVALLKDLIAVGEFSNSLIPLFPHHLSDFVTADAHARARSGVGGGGAADAEGDFPDGVQRRNLALDVPANTDGVTEGEK